MFGNDWNFSDIMSELESLLTTGLGALDVGSASLGDVGSVAHFLW